MAIIRDYNYKMGFEVNGVPIPDPAVFTGKASALDSSGARDANGLLHRCMVATKHPIKMEYHGISWTMMREIMGKMTGQSFQFTFPDPKDGLITITAYVGDRDWETHMAPATVNRSGGVDNWMNDWYGDLKFSVIEY